MSQISLPPPHRLDSLLSIDPTILAPSTRIATLTAEEVRAKIAANRKRQSDVIRRSAALSYTNSRTVSQCSLPGSGWQTHRLRRFAPSNPPQTNIKDLPIQEAGLAPSPLILHGRDAARGDDAASIPWCQSVEFEDFHAYSNPRAVPLPPPIKTDRVPSPLPRNRNRLTKAKSCSPLSTVSMPQDEDYFSSSSRDSARNSASTTDSVASSATSTSSFFREEENKPTSTQVPNFSKPTSAIRKEKPAMEISLPYSCEVDGDSAEKVKTAKSAIPTWRYEDLNADNQLPIAMPTIPAVHTRNKSWGYGRKPTSSFGTMFRRRNDSVTGF